SLPALVHLFRLLCFVSFCPVCSSSIPRAYTCIHTLSLHDALPICNCWYLNNIRARFGTSTSFHVSNALAATCTARSKSARVEIGTRAITSPVAGLYTFSDC